MPTDEEIKKLIETIEAGSEEPQEGGATHPEETENWQERFEEANANLEKANIRIATLEEQNQKLFDSMAKMVKATPVSLETPQPPQTESQRVEQLRENFDIRKLDFT